MSTEIAIQTLIITNALLVVAVLFSTYVILSGISTILNEIVKQYKERIDEQSTS